jgi:hypothetical protein
VVQSLISRVVGTARASIGEGISVAMVLAAAAAILVLACAAPPVPSDAAQASLMYHLVTSL